MAALPQSSLSLTSKELFDLCALDSDFYRTTFFPLTFRQESPPFHKEMWDLLEDQAHRYVALEVFRGGAKTTTLRTYASKRIAYGISRTIAIISAAQEHSKKSLKWIKTQIERNKIWTDVYGLARGRKWTDEELEIEHKLLGFTIAVVALGITGQTRGINIEDYRPDLIIVDDPCDEENTGTPEQRKKISELFFGSIEKSLTPASECPDAKMCLLQTSLNEEDLINGCHRDQRWASRKFGCFDPDGNSRWPARFPTSVLLEDKEAHIDKGQLALWMREMECQIISGGTCDLRTEWMKELEEHQLPELLVVHMGIDPVPPPSERELALGMTKKDYETLYVWGVGKGGYYGLDYARSKGHTPEWTVTEFFRLVEKWNPIKVRIEGIAYQRTLKWILEQEMHKRCRYVQINAVADKRKKRHRIIQAFSGPGSTGRLHVPRGWYAFREQFSSFPNCNHDDDLDSSAMAIDSANELAVGVEFEDLDMRQKDIPSLGNWRAAP